MGAVLLCEFPASDGAARPWILARLAPLAVRGGAELQFVGTEERTVEVVAIRFGDAALAGATLTAWRADRPAAIAIRLLRMEPVPAFPAGLFP